MYTASWDLLLANPLWQALFGEWEQWTGRPANLTWRLFHDDLSAVLGSDLENDHFARSMVSDLHGAAGRYPDDRGLASMITDLRATSDRFTQLWARYTVAPQASERKTIRSPTVGPVTVDCDILTAAGSDLRIVVYTARPGSPDADKLELLRVTGIQTLAP